MARARRHELDLRKVDLASSVGAFLGAIEMIVIAVNAAAVKWLLT
jgi:hypothetical protein